MEIPSQTPGSLELIAFVAGDRMPPGRREEIQDLIDSDTNLKVQIGFIQRGLGIVNGDTENQDDILRTEIEDAATTLEFIARDREVVPNLNEALRRRLTTLLIEIKDFEVAVDARLDEIDNEEDL